MNIWNKSFVKQYNQISPFKRGVSIHAVERNGHLWPIFDESFTNKCSFTIVNSALFVKLSSNLVSQLTVRGMSDTVRERLQKGVSIGLLCICFCLSGCFGVVITGASAIYNHNRIQNATENHYLTWRTYHDIYDDPELAKSSHINVASVNHVVLLVGQTPSEKLQRRAVALAQQIPGVTRVINQITIEAPTQTVVQIHDTWLTTQIKAQIVAAQNIDPSKIKVITENGTVYLMGSVTRSEADIAVAIAQYTEGVQKVVKVFLLT